MIDSVDSLGQFAAICDISILIKVSLIRVTVLRRWDNWNAEYRYEPNGQHEIKINKIKLV